jgi:hypothetical protein
LAAQAGQAVYTGEVEALAAGNKYQVALQAAAGMSGFASDKVAEFATDMFKMGGVAHGYTLQFSADIADVGLTFGLTGAEAVAMATKIGVAARANEASTRRAFLILGQQSQKLHVPMEALAEPMEELATLAGMTGRSLESATGDLLTMTDAVSKLGNTGLKMFQHMSGAEVTRFTKQFTDMFLKIDDVTLSAMTFNRNESFGGMVKRVAEMGTTGKNSRMSAIRDFMKNYELQGNNPDSQYRLGVMLGANPNDFKGALGMGAFAQSATKRGMSDSEFQAQQAGKIDAELASRKTAGAAIAVGEDPIHFFMDKITHVVFLLQAIAGKFGVGGGETTAATTTAAAAAVAKPASGPSPKVNYGAHTTRRPGLHPV